MSYRKVLSERVLRMKTGSLLCVSLVLLQACAVTEVGRRQDISIEEAFHTSRDEGDNVDSPAVWHGPAGQHWLLATAKEGNTILVYDATSGDFLDRFGDGGTGEGQFERPNGIAVIDDLMLVVERDNRRIQVFTLPDFQSIGMLTHEDLRMPYGLALAQNSDGSYELYVTDNFNPALEGYPPEEELDERIHHFRFRVNGRTLVSEHINTFGDIAGAGVLHKVESIHLDPVHERLLIADEAFSQRSVKVYNLEGRFTGEIIPAEHFTSEPEGIALYACDNGAGYWIITDQHPNEQNSFQVFDRVTLGHIGTFRGVITRNTDGVWLSQRAFGPFPHGAFFPVHDDGSITAIDWSDISQGLSLQLQCTLP